MIIKSELVKKIKDYFGLNIYETKVWLALLGKGVSAAGEIATISGVPRSRTYDVLESLEKQGFAIARLGKPVKYIAVKPELIIEKLKRNIMAEAEERRELLSDVRSTTEYKEIELLHKQGIQPIKATDLSGAIKGRNIINLHLKDLVGRAEKEVILVGSIAALTKESKFLKTIFSRLKRKNVKIKVGVAEKSAEKEAGKLMEELKILSKEIGTEIKKMQMNARFCIVDGKEILFMIMPHEIEAEQDIGVWINSEFFASALGKLFDLAW